MASSIFLIPLLVAAGLLTQTRPVSPDADFYSGAGLGCEPVCVRGETVEISMVELIKFKYEPGKPLPKKIQDLDGKDVVITGFMHPDTGYDVDSFLLVNESCACGASPEPNHFVEVTLTGDKTSRKRGELTFRGTFSVGEELDENGFVTSLFRLEGDFY